MSDREAENESFATSGVLSLKTLAAGYNESILKVCVCVCVCGYPTEPEDVCQCTQHQQVCICAVCTHTHTHKSENKIWCIYTHIEKYTGVKEPSTCSCYKWSSATL